MQINVKLDEGFTSAFYDLCRKYGDELRSMNGFSESQLNYTDFIDHFIDKNSKNVADASIDGNSNVSTKDITSLLNEMNKPHMKLLSFNKIYCEMRKKYGTRKANEWLESEWNGKFYLHDSFSASFLSYCFSYDLSMVAREGLFFVNDFNNQAPKHLVTFTDFTAEFVSWVSNRTSGGCSIPNFLVWSYYFWKKDCETGYYIKTPEYYRDQEFQRIVYKLNQPFLRITQSAYTTLSILDQDYLVELFGGMEYPDGSYVIDYIDEIIEYEKAFMGVVRKCHEQNMMTFPVISAALIYDHENHKFKNEEFARWCSDSNAKWMDTNFSIDEGVNAISSCCRLRNSLEINSMGNFSSIGGSALEIGSVKVNSINLACIAYESEGNVEKYLGILEKRVALCCEVLNAIRTIIRRNVEKGLLPNYSLGIINVDKQYCTVGVSALYEAVRKMGFIETDEFDCVTYTQEGIEFARRIFDVITKVKDKHGEEYGFMYNIEQIPGERACSIFLQKDRLLYPNEEYTSSLYSNQWISLSEKTTMHDKVAVGEQLDSYMGGGVISHYNFDAPFNDEEIAWKLLNYIAEHHIPYFAFNGKVNSCVHNHGFYEDKCPICGEAPATTWTRVVGFCVPRKNMSKERRFEHDNRWWDKTLELGDFC